MEPQRNYNKTRCYFTDNNKTNGTVIVVMIEYDQIEKQLELHDFEMTPQREF